MKELIDGTGRKRMFTKMRDMEIKRLRQALTNIAACLGYDPYHVGDSVEFLQRIIEDLLKEASNALRFPEGNSP